MRTSCVKNGLVMVVILLFIGIAVQPIIIAGVSIESDDSEFVEVTIRIYKLRNIEEYTLMLTQEQVEEFNNEFDDFKVRLDNAVTKSETLDFYNDMIVSLDRLGILPDYMSVDELRHLVTGRNHLVSGNELSSKLFENSNFFCLISGRASDSDCLLVLIPIHIGGIMYFGTYTEFHPISGGIMNYPAREHSTGWIKTDGILGRKEWDGDFYGGIFNLLINVVALEFFIFGHVGAVGFTGFTIHSNLFEASFIGFAPWVKIKEV